MSVYSTIIPINNHAIISSWSVFATFWLVFTIFMFPYYIGKMSRLNLCRWTKSKNVGNFFSFVAKVIPSAVLINDRRLAKVRKEKKISSFQLKYRRRTKVSGKRGTERVRERLLEPRFTSPHNVRKTAFFSPILLFTSKPKTSACKFNLKRKKFESSRQILFFSLIIFGAKIQTLFASN